MEGSTSVVIETRHLTRIYGDGTEIRALDDVNLLVGHGELITVMGPSGSGKSTLLNIIGALDKPTSGQVLIKGQDLEKIRNKDEFRAKMVGFVFQLHNLIPTLTARENIEVPMMGYMNIHARHERSLELIRLVGLEDRMKHLPNQLSGGQRQRVAVARALANNPSVILADEPTGSLDSLAGGELMDLINELNRSQGTTFIIVTHDPAVARKTRRIVLMCDGKISREDMVGTTFEEDIKNWQHTVLGQQILSGDRSELLKIGIPERSIAAMRQFLLTYELNVKGKM